MSKQLTRAQVQALADFTEGRFQNLSQRNFLDRMISDSHERLAVDDGDTVHRYQRRTYSALDAVKLRLFDQLTRDGGISNEQASRIVANTDRGLLDQLGNILDGAEEFWVAAIFFKSEGVAVYCVSTDALPRVIGNSLDDFPDEGVYRLVVANTSLAVKEVIAAAERYLVKIDWDL